MFSMTQGFLTGIPIVIVTRDIPEAFYLTLTFLLFALCMVILLLIFVPKIWMHGRYKQMSPAEQQKAMAVSIRQSVASRELSAQQFGSSVFRTAIKKEQAAKAQNKPNDGAAQIPPIQLIAEGDASSSNPSSSAASGAFVEKISDDAPSKKASYLEDIVDTDTDVHQA